MGKLFSQLVINTTGTKPDFNNEEKASIEKDTRELRQIVREMAEYLPREDPEKGITKSFLTSIKVPTVILQCFNIKE